MKNTYSRFIKAAALLMLMYGAMMTSAQAGQDKNKRQSVAVNAQWQAECGSCHIAYLPRMLPAESWRAVMSGLDRHFGSDASLEPAVAKEIGTFLEANAGKKPIATASQPLLRITETGWFKREHRKVAAKVWTSDWVKSPANCSACHTQAAYSDYRERNIKLPQL